MESVVCKFFNANSKYFFLNDDVIEEIVCRLDAKSVMRYKCVCKRWLSLLSHPSFVIRHLKHQVPRVLLHVDKLANTDVGDLMSRIRSDYVMGPKLSVRRSDNFDQISAHIFPVSRWSWESPDFRFVGSQNGVVCLSQQNDDVTFYLWNPAIRKIKKLPLSQSRPPSFYGFGYESLTRDFKVVVISATSQGFHFDVFQKGQQVRVYSFRNNSWKTMDMPELFIPSSAGILPMPYCVVVNGSIHWLLFFMSTQLPSVLDSFGIVAFDISTERFNFIKGFSSIKPPINAQCLTLCNLSGSLSVLTYDAPGLAEIWVMKEYGVSDSWTKHFSLDFVKQSLGPFRPLGVWENGKLLLVGVDESFYFYDSNTNTNTNRVEYVGPWLHVLQFTTYVESIFLS